MPQVQRVVSGSPSTSTRTTDVDKVLERLKRLSEDRARHISSLGTRNDVNALKDLGFGGSEIDSYLMAWPTPAGPEEVRKSVERRLKDMLS